MLHSAAVIKTVVKLINMDDELQMLGSIILTNMLLESTVDSEAFRKVAVENMLKLVMSRDIAISEMCVLCLCFASQSESCRSVIIGKGLLEYIDASRIFKEPRISYAYLAMFENIANNPAMRSELLDEHLILRFSEVCKLNDKDLNLAVAKALYSVSCNHSNIIKLTDQNVLPILLTIWHTERENPTAKCDDVMKNLVAIVYNLCTNEVVYPKLVQHGIMRVMIDFWEVAEKDFKYAQVLLNMIFL